jgi:HPt (histidine-containing phosphotransfer) domain-containing protein
MGVQVADFKHLPASIQQEFLDLRENFIEGLRERWDEIQSSEGTEEFGLKLHRLVGAAACFGLVDLSTLARKAEICFKNGETEHLLTILEMLRVAMNAQGLKGENL